MNLIYFYFLIATVSSLPRRRKLNDDEKRSDLGGDLGIVNGKKSHKMIPFLCSLLEMDKHICGCTILDANTILTASHCFKNELPAAAYNVGVGSTKIAEQIIYEVDFYLVHEEFNKTQKYNNDVAIIKLENSIEMKPGLIASVILYDDCTGTAGGIPFGANCLVAGWGYLNETYGKSTDDLFETTVEILPFTDPSCEIFYLEGKLSETMLCAGSLIHKNDSCQGDSGGGLFNSFNEQVGIVGWGRGCGRENLAGIYTNICAVSSWIDENRYKDTL